MVYKKGTTHQETRVAMREGPGEVKIRELTGPEGRPVKCRLFNEMVLETSCGIGLHPHAGETEFYYILSGTGVVDDDGTELMVEAGDCMSTGKGAKHSIVNNGQEPLVMVACVILD
jgi:mannose-6-phosphate isomerase-like protein (cupin superfamily)